MHKLLCLLVFYSVAVSFAQQTLFEQFTRQDGLLDDTVYDILLGTDGNIWLATAGGVSRFNGLDFQSYGPNEGLDGAEVLGMHRDPNGLTWCFTSGANVYHYAPESERFQAIPANPALAKLAGDNIINDLHVDAAGNAWISTVIGGALYRVASGSNQPEPMAVDSFPGTFYARELDDNGIIAGSQESEQGKDRVRLVLNDTAFEVNLSGDERYTRSSALLLQDGSFLYAKNSEIVHFDRFGVRARLFVEKSVQHLLQDSEQKIWISLYQGGVKCYPQGIGFPNNVIEYLGTRSVAGIAEDGSGNIWFATLGDGVYYMPLRPQLEYASPSIFSTTDPNQVEQVTQPVILEQELLTSGIAQPSGIRAFSPFVDSLPPMIFISGMVLDGRDTTTHEQYTLPHNFKSVRINYVGFASQRGATMQYKYRMTGLDEEWVFSSSNFAEYHFLPPGEYAFEVSAMNPAGYWSQQPAVVHFRVHPAFWRTWWFITTSIALGLVLASTGGAVWLRRVKRKEREKAEIDRRITEVELQALRAQMNPHFLFNTLSSIQHYITINDSKAALTYLSKFARLMRQIMENSKRPVIPLKDELHALKLYLELEAQRFKGKFTYTITTGEGVDEHYDEIPSMLIQPYVENAILHGIMNKPDSGVIAVRVDKEDGYLTCVVEDDGVGREQAAALKRESKHEHRSRGLSITKERLELLNTARDSALSVDITDLKAPNGTPAGTRVKVFIPLGRT